jgi:hypothetical protein
MHWLVYLLIAILPVALYVVLTIMPHLYRRMCPGCSNRRLRWCSEMKGIGFVNGRSATTLREYYVCEECCEAFKRLNKGEFEAVSHEERDQHINRPPEKSKKAKPKKRK